MAYTTDMIAGVTPPVDYSCIVSTRKRMDFLLAEPNQMPSGFQAGTAAMYAISIDKYAGCVTTVGLCLGH